MIQAQDIIRIGTLRRPHGKQGEIQCYAENSYWEDSDAEFLIVEIDGIPVPFRVTDWREKGADMLVFRLAGINDEEQAARLCGNEAYMLRSDLSADAEEQLTWQDLVGYSIEDTTRGHIGTVRAIDESTINTLIETDDGRLLPCHEDLIEQIDTSARILYVHLPEGL
ncbi:MAG: ribosome maturation factor RimM [Paludibacteraceae bacterium]